MATNNRNQHMGKLTLLRQRLARKAALNMALFQAGLTVELQPLLLSITFGAWRQVAAFKPRLQQALKRYSQPFRARAIPAADSTQPAH